MALAGGFRLAFWSEQAEHHGPRLERALARYQRFSDVRPPGWPASPVAALARFLSGHVRRQDGPEHGMAYDIQRFNELTKQMSAYAHYQRGPEHFELAAKRAARRARARELAEQLNQRLRFRLGEHGPAVAAADRAAAAGLRAPGAPGRRAHAVRRARSASCGSSSATSGSSPAGIPAMPTAATAPPTATRSGGGCRCPPGGGRGRRREASAPVSSVCGRSARRDAMHARRPDCQPPAPRGGR